MWWWCAPVLSNGIFKVPSASDECVVVVGKQLLKQRFLTGSQDWPRDWFSLCTTLNLKKYLLHFKVRRFLHKKTVLAFLQKGKKLALPGHTGLTFHMVVATRHLSSGALCRQDRPVQVATVPPFSPTRLTPCWSPQASCL